MKAGVRYLSIEEFDRLKAACENIRDKILISLLYETGCTVNELINLKVSDIKGDTIHFSQENTRQKTARIAVISHELHIELAHYCLPKKHSDFLLSSRQSENMTTKRCRQIVQKLSKKALGYAINPQTLRYTHIAHALEKNVPMMAIQHQVGLDALRFSQLAEQLGKKTMRGYEHFFAH